MGKIVSGHQAWSSVRLPTRAGGGGGSCSTEFVAYLACLDKEEGKEETCRVPREALSRCMYAAAANARNNTHKVPINYHLQKFIKGFKR